MAEALKGRAKGVLLIGAAAPLIERALGDRVETTTCGTLEQAVRHAWQHAAPGDIVLLAPACASFDQFEDFEDRGRKFKQEVAKLF